MEFINQLLNNFKTGTWSVVLAVIGAILSIGSAIMLLMLITTVIKFFAMRKRGEDTSEMILTIVIYLVGFVVAGSFGAMSFASLFN